jgi:hypothetical protein
MNGKDLQYRTVARHSKKRSCQHEDKDVKRCERCGEIDFLARDWTHPLVPALCMECHDKADTTQAKTGHRCEQYCKLPQHHIYLCLNGT